MQCYVSITYNGCCVSKSNIQLEREGETDQKLHPNCPVQDVTCYFAKVVLLFSFPLSSFWNSFLWTLHQEMDCKEFYKCLYSMPRCVMFLGAITPVTLFSSLTSYSHSTFVLFFLVES